MFLGSTSWPNSQARPSLAGSRPVSIFMVVDLPQPFEPRKPKISPLRMRKLTWSTATKSPKRMVRSRASMAISAWSSSASGTMRTGSWPRRFSSGKSAMKASSSEAARPRACSPAGVSWASTRPSSSAISQSKRRASSM